MAYISAEEIDVIRKELKAAFPAKQGWKFLISRSHHSGINVAIAEAPLELRNNTDEAYENVNEHWISERANKESIVILKDMLKIINKKNFDKSDLQSDYHNVGFYTNLSIGKWDKPFKLSDKKYTPKAPEPVKKEEKVVTRSWIETHHEIVAAITLILNSDQDAWPEYFGLIEVMEGMGGFYDLAETLTDKFEEANKGREWDGDFFDTIEEFLKVEFND